LAQAHCLAGPACVRRQAHLDAELDAFQWRWCFLLLGGFYLITDVQMRKRWPFLCGRRNEFNCRLLHRPFIRAFISRNLATHLGRDFFNLLAQPTNRWCVERWFWQSLVAALLDVSTEALSANLTKKPKLSFRLCVI